MAKTIALLSDFGDRDTYVGVMKGVMLSIAPDSRLVDITHNVDPQHVRQGAFMLRNVFDYFPNGTIFLVVIDPGVGSMRRPVAVRAGHYTFVAPDNGVLSYVLDALGQYEAVELTNPQYKLPYISRTFHGRDIFAPAAAHLAAGVPLRELGDPAGMIARLPKPELSVRGKRVVGEVMHIDHFGNITTSIGYLFWDGEETLGLKTAFGGDLVNDQISAEHSTVLAHGELIYTIRASYSEALRGDLLALVGSSGYLEIAVNQGNAAERLDVAVGDRVEFEMGDVNAAVSD
jgi:S-adenosyl-L-methionine hydrolase (adenosine-forming)